jgi:hypothetical protein
MKALITILVAWAMWEHDRRIKLELFARMALPLVVEDMRRRGVNSPVNREIAGNIFDLYRI